MLSSRIRHGVAPTLLATAVVLLGLVAPAAARGSVSAGSAAVSVVAWRPCVPAGNVTAAMDCAEFPLPLDYAQPAGPEIRLHVLRVRATGTPVERIGSLFVNPGGPGGSGTGLAANAPGFLSPTLLRHFDIVGFDPRGVAGSRPALDCPAVEGPSPSVGWATYFPATAAIEQPAHRLCDRHRPNSRSCRHQRRGRGPRPAARCGGRRKVELLGRILRDPHRMDLCRKVS